MNTFLLIVKYTAAALSGAYGIYATLTDFHEQKNGKRVLSTKGVLGIFLLVAIAVLGLTSDALQDVKEKQRAREDAQKQKRMLDQQQSMNTSVSAELQNTKTISVNLQDAIAQIDGNSRRVVSNIKATNSVIHQAARLLDPLQLKGSDMNATFLVDPELVPASWLRRITRLHSSFGDPDFPSEDHQEERPLFDRLFKDPAIRIWTVEKARESKFEPFSPETWNLYATGDCKSRKSDDSRLGLQIVIGRRFSSNGGEQDKVTIDCRTQIAYAEAKGNTRSYQDLIGSAFFVEFGSSDEPVTPLEVSVFRGDGGRWLQVEKFRPAHSHVFEATIQTQNLR